MDIETSRAGRGWLGPVSPFERFSNYPEGMIFQLSRRDDFPTFTKSGYNKM